MGLLLLVALACPFAEEQGERVWSAEDSYAEFAVSTLGFFSAGACFVDSQAGFFSTEGK